jgi:actin-related protein 6
MYTLHCIAAALIPHGGLFSSQGLPRPECMLVVDVGFSFTHIVPIMGGTVLWSAVKRYADFHGGCGTVTS